MASPMPTPGIVEVSFLAGVSTFESFLEKSVKTAYHFPLTFRIVFSQLRLDDLCQLS